MTVVDALPTSEPPPPVRPRRRGRTVLVWVLLLAVCGGVFGVAVAGTIPSAYVAEGSLVLTPLRGNAYQSGTNKILTDLETESQLVTSDVVLRRVAADGGDTPPAAVVRNRVSVSVVPSAAVLTIRYHGDSPEQAREMVERLAKATLAERVERSRAAGAQQVVVIESLLEDAKGDRDAIVATALKQGTPPSPAQLRLAGQRIVSLGAQLAEAKADPGNPGRLVTLVSRGDGGTRRVRLAVVGGFVLVAAGLGFWVGRATRTRTR